MHFKWKAIFPCYSLFKFSRFFVCVISVLELHGYHNLKQQVVFRISINLLADMTQTSWQNYHQQLTPCSKHKNKSTKLIKRIGFYRPSSLSLQHHVLLHGDNHFLNFSAPLPIRRSSPLLPCFIWNIMCHPSSPIFPEQKSLFLDLLISFIKSFKTLDFSKYVCHVTTLWRYDITLEKILKCTIIK